jgi:hypothetical protein
LLSIHQAGDKVTERLEARGHIKPLNQHFLAQHDAPDLYDAAKAPIVLQHENVGGLKEGLYPIVGAARDNFSKSEETQTSTSTIDNKVQEYIYQAKQKADLLVNPHLKREYKKSIPLPDDHFKEYELTIIIEEVRRKLCGDKENPQIENSNYKGRPERLALED